MVGCDSNPPMSEEIFKLFEKIKINGEFCNVTVMENNNSTLHDAAIERFAFIRNIDIHKVDHSSHNLTDVNNFHNNVMEVIKQNLNESHSKAFCPNEDGTPQGPSAICVYNYDETNGQEEIDGEKSFARVGLVRKGSPADIGGLRENDKIIKFGSINANNYSDFSQLQDILMESIDKPLHIRVRRDNDIFDLTVVPQRWIQRGCFGCQIIKQWCIVRMNT